MGAGVQLLIVGTWGQSVTVGTWGRGPAAYSAYMKAGGSSCLQWVHVHGGRGSAAYSSYMGRESSCFTYLYLYARLVYTAQTTVYTARSYQSDPKLVELFSLNQGWVTVWWVID